MNWWKKNLPVLLYIRKGYLVSSKIKILKTGSNPSPHFSLFFCDQNVILHDGLITSILDYYIKKQVINIENLALVLQVGIWACALPVFAKAEHVCATPMKLVDRKKKKNTHTYSMLHYNESKHLINTNSAGCPCFFRHHQHINTCLLKGRTRVCEL